MIGVIPVIQSVGRYVYPASREVMPSPSESVKLGTTPVQPWLITKVADFALVYAAVTFTGTTKLSGVLPKVWVYLKLPLD